jgi:NADH:ubiquinone oxidoreductase subunit B-like Fe-S oxidoreductase
MDILVLEGYLERKEQQKLGKAYEQYKKTPKFLSIK